MVHTDKPVISIIQGPNLNMLGERNPDIYGDIDFTSYLEKLRTRFPRLEIQYYQSNIEGELITAIQEAGAFAQGIILNAAAYTHTSVGIGDAVEAVSIPVVEVHISNIWNREGFRQKSYIAAHAAGHITGFGLKVYDLALEYFRSLLDETNNL